MRLLFINGILNYPVRTEMFEGRRHVVVPVVALVEGVHNGSGGALFYPWSEISKYPAAWNGRPVVAPTHPHNENGEPISANSPQIIAERSIGQVFNTTAAEHKLTAELWLDEEKTRRIAPEVLSMIQANKPIEESTGFFSDALAGTGIWNGEEYDATVVNIRPDHIALLPGTVGACSIADGCGVRANVRAAARTPSFEGTESTSWANVDKSFGAYRDAYYAAHSGRPDEPVSRVQDAPTAMKNWIASKTLLGEGGADNERDLLMFPVVNPKTGKLNEGALRAVLGGRGSAADIPEAAKTSAQNKARSLLNRHFGAELETAQEESLMKKVVKALASVIDKLAGNETSHEDIGMQLREWADKQDTVERINWVRDVYDGWFVHEVSVRNPATGARIANKMYRRTYSVDDNGQVAIGEETTEVLEKKEYVPVEAPAGNEEKTQISNKEGNEVDKAKLIKTLIECPNTRFEAADEEWLKNLSEGQLEKLRAQDPPAAPATKPAEPVTLESYVKGAPPEIQAILNEAVEERKALKAKIVENLKANKGCQFSDGELAAMELGQLRKLATLAQVEVPEPDYTGQSGAPKTSEETKVPPMPSTLPEPAKK